MTYTELWFHAFVVTLGVELVVAVPLLRKAEPSWIRRVGAVLFANLASHPLVWFVIPRFGLGHISTDIVCEAWAIGLELVFYQFVFRIGFVQALSVSALANGASLAVGLLLRSVTSWL